MFLNLVLITVLIKDLGHLGIALALSVSSWANAFLLYIFIAIRGFWKVDYQFFKRLLKFFFVFFISLNTIQGIEYAILFFDLVSVSNFIQKILLLIYLVIISIITFIFFCLAFRIFKIKDLSKRKLTSILKE